ncbi:hypothetical protein [Jeotgalibacillus proteolyticus]|uniref:Uncharacterized protein n=1 Tax=Jeotgalibacillus proteolyticus TaxID=2082395 RepID=A0A2S5GAK3_9BACL|nr:hypothetical protein [Jeotgalibacillus proteolyticus]PPA70029.1 hypothetical protein C4B60_10560 [Jeotgalibacillus proteolyticus]
MDKTTLFKSIEGLFAYDTGCVDSGIKDEYIKHEVFSYLNSLSENGFRILLSEYIREYYVSENAIAKGYGIEDVAEFLRWLSDNGIDL